MAFKDRCFEGGIASAASTSDMIELVLREMRIPGDCGSEHENKMVISVNYSEAWLRKGGRIN